MADPRPRPEYGEYATPEQQAAAMGRAYVPSTDPASPPVANAPASNVPAPGETAAPTSLRLGGNLIDRFVTIFQLGVGLFFLVSSDFFHLAENANIGLAEAGFSQRVPLAMDHYAWWVLGANILLLVATFAWAFVTLRRGRLAFYIPFVGYLVFSIVLAGVLLISR